MKVLQIWGFVDDRYYRNEKMAQAWRKIGETEFWRSTCIPEIGVKKKSTPIFFFVFSRLREKQILNKIFQFFGPQDLSTKNFQFSPFYFSPIFRVLGTQNYVEEVASLFNKFA
jgi:hypothetical protein